MTPFSSSQTMSDEFEPSRLGTKEHWDSVYNQELGNFQDDSENEGEVWFGLESVEKMVDWALTNVPSASSPYVLDIGAGNGVMSVSLAQAGYSVDHILGVDYSADSVRLAKAVAAHRSFPALAFEAGDFLVDDPSPLPGMPTSSGGWDLLLDKGTYDAIALASNDEAGATPAEGYPPRVAHLMKQGGYFLITSCNFTEDELKSRFDTPDSGLRYHSRIQHKTFTFGGKTGSVCSSVAFQKK